jgi:hypothetical protein
MERARTGARTLPSLGRAALIAGGTYLFVASFLPLLHLVRSVGPEHQAWPLAPGRNAMLFDFLMLAAFPAAVLVIAGWRLDRGAATRADGLLRLAASVVSVYLLAGSLVSSADPESTAIAVAMNVAVACAALAGLVALARRSGKPVPLDAPA